MVLRKMRQSTQLRVRKALTTRGGRNCAWMVWEGFGRRVGCSAPPKRPNLPPESRDGLCRSDNCAKYDSANVDRTSCHFSDNSGERAIQSRKDR